MLYNSCQRDRKRSGSVSDSGMNYWRNNNMTVWWIISVAAGSLSWGPPGLFLLLSCIQKNDLIPGIYKRKCHILSNQIQSSVFFEALLELWVGLVTLQSSVRRKLKPKTPFFSSLQTFSDWSSNSWFLTRAFAVGDCPSTAVSFITFPRDQLGPVIASEAEQPLTCAPTG